MSEFAGMTKHVGVLNNTGKNVVVVYMRLPNDPNNALVIDTDALPDTYNESLRKIVESVEGQQALDLADVLGRRMSPDGSQLTLLQKFHSAGRLEKVPVNLVSMTPRRGVRLSLADVLASIDSVKENEPIGFDDLDPETRAELAADLKTFNVHASNLNETQSQNRKEEAVSLIRQAELLENDAHNMRVKAYKIDPSLVKKTKAKTLEQPTVDINEAVKLTLAKSKTPKVKKETVKKETVKDITTTDKLD